MQMNSNGYIQRSAAQWQEIVTRYRQSGLGQQEFCAAEGLTVRTLAKWVRRLRFSTSLRPLMINSAQGCLIVSAFIRPTIADRSPVLPQ